jgi:hypothetical protein
MSSAVYFTGENMTPEQIRNITKGANNHHFKCIILRNQWVGLLNQHIQTSGTSASEKMDMLSWSKHTIIYHAIPKQCISLGIFK